MWTAGHRLAELSRRTTDLGLTFVGGRDDEDANEAMDPPSIPTDLVTRVILRQPRAAGDQGRPLSGSTRSSANSEKTSPRKDCVRSLGKLLAAADELEQQTRGQRYRTGLVVEELPPPGGFGHPQRQPLRRAHCYRFAKANAHTCLDVLAPTRTS
jgi:hypothetical protein